MMLKPIDVSVVVCAYTSDRWQELSAAVDSLVAQGERPTWHPPEFGWVVGCSYRGLPVEPAPVRNLIGCNMSMRRELFDAVGGFTHGIGRIGTIPLGCEETEWCIRVRQRFPELEFL